jgi:hypothetical protein
MGILEPGITVLGISGLVNLAVGIWDSALWDLAF